MPDDEIKKIEAMTLKEFFNSDIFVIVHSDLLGEDIGFASNDTVAKSHKDLGLTIYTAKELKKLHQIGVLGEDLAAIHRAKKMSGGYITGVKSS